MREKNGFTLIEILITMSILAILTYAFVAYFNPVGQLSQARNSQRSLHLNAIINGVKQNIADNRGTFSCAAGDIPTVTKKMAVGAGNYDIASCIVPVYIAVMPYDPVALGARYSSNADYDTGYNVYQNSSTLQITLSAPSAELGKSISVTR